MDWRAPNHYKQPLISVPGRLKLIMLWNLRGHSQPIGQPIESFAMKAYCWLMELILRGGCNPLGRKINYDSEIIGNRFRLFIFRMDCLGIIGIFYVGGVSLVI